METNGWMCAGARWRCCRSSRGSLGPHKSHGTHVLCDNRQRGGMAWKDREQRNEYQRAYRLKLGMKPRVTRPRERTTWLNCEQPIGRNSTKFCSNHCHRTYEHVQFVDKWLGGEVVGGSAAGVSRHIRRYLLAEGGERCSRCGWCERHPTTGRVPLEVDHLNGNYTDNRRENVRLLCPNCHALTLTFKALNKGNGRPYDAQILWKLCGSR